MATPRGRGVKRRAAARGSNGVVAKATVAKATVAKSVSRKAAPAQPASRLLQAVRRSHLLFLVAAALTGLAVAGVRLVQTDARADLLMDPTSPAYADQQLYANTFGADPVVVVLKP